ETLLAGWSPTAATCTSLRRYGLFELPARAPLRLRRRFDCVEPEQGRADDRRRARGSHDHVGRDPAQLRLDRSAQPAVARLKQAAAEPDLRGPLAQLEPLERDTRHRDDL